MMLRPPRRRSGRSGPQLCAAAVALFLLLLSLFVLHSRLSSSSSPLLRIPLPSSVLSRRPPSSPAATVSTAVLFSDDPDSVDADSNASDDRIDELDVLEDDEDHGHRSLEDDSDDLDPDDLFDPSKTSAGGSGSLYWDHALGVARRSFDKPERRHRFLDPWGDGDGRGVFRFDNTKFLFGSDDQPVVDEGVRVKLDSIGRIEDALLLKTGGGEEPPFRKGWARWLEGKGDFLRRDRMLRSNLEALNPKNHPLLQDPDGPGLTALTRGDRLVQSALLKEMEKTPFRPLSVSVTSKVEGRKTLHLDKEDEKKGERRKMVSTEQQHIYADGQRWGYFPGLDAHMTFSNFMDHFLGNGGCLMRVFMVWNSPPWMFGVRHQRGLESLLHHHRNACVVVFSETMELDFFRDFVKDGFKVAVAMPNLDELLKDTPTQIFASVWFQWRKTKYYSIHYSELIRLAALYKYGGIYLDSDVIVLKPLHLLKNSIPLEDQNDGPSSYNGAVMAFEKNSTFIWECLNEFYSTYDDTRLRWNGVDLMTRVINRISSKADKLVQLDIKIEPCFAFYPINSMNITRYFAEPVDKLELVHQDALLTRMLNESFTFHLWNGLTSALVPESNSLVERLLNQYCIRCHDVL